MKFFSLLFVMLCICLKNWVLFFGVIIILWIVFMNCLLVNGLMMGVLVCGLNIGIMFSVLLSGWLFLLNGIFWMWLFVNWWASSYRECGLIDYLWLICFLYYIFSWMLWWLLLELLGIKLKEVWAWKV